MTDKRVEEIRARLDAVIEADERAKKLRFPRHIDQVVEAITGKNKASNAVGVHAYADLRYLLARVEALEGERDALIRRRDEWKANAIHEANKREPKP